MRLKRSLLMMASITIASLSACQNENTTTETLQTNELKTSLVNYPLSDVLSCLPEKNAIITAHRGISRAWDMPENSMGGLKRLIDEGTLIAEIDVAGLKDGKHILFHDGVWDKKTTGKGPVASSNWGDVEKMLLKSFAGTLSSERPPLFSDILKASKGKIFLEVDFKSSAKTDIVLKQIRETDMQDQVVLIAYTHEQAKELHALAPEMLISAPGDSKGKALTPSKTLLWMGRAIDESLQPTNTAGYIGLLGRDDNTDRKSGIAKFLVSDWSTEYPAILGPNNQSVIMECLQSK